VNPSEGVTAEVAAAIERAIDARRDDAVELLRALVRVPSVTGDEGLVQDVVQAAMGERGLVVDRWEASEAEIEPYVEHVGRQARYAGRPNLAGRLSGAGGGRSILLNAHIDTVGNGDPALWSHDPNAGDVSGDLLYGRGACDMKGGLVSYLIALDGLRDVLRAAGGDSGLRGDVIVNTTVGEEDGGLGALSTILRGYRADAALISEPTRLALVTAQGGSLVFRLTVPGKSAHAAVRDEGISALEQFIPIFQALQALERERNATLRHPLYDGIANKVPINVGVVHASGWASTVPESLVAEGRVGLLPGESMEWFRDVVTHRIMDAASQSAWLREHPPSIEWFGGQFAPAETPLDAPLAQAVGRAHQRVTGSPPNIEAVTYGADMRLFTLLGGMPCVMYGAGDVRVAHHADEHINITELLTAAKTIACLLAEWCGVEMNGG
jgi:acetylornithine deacetylase